MRIQGRYLRFRHVFPEVFAPGVQARRGLLRLRWLLLQRIDLRPIWTTGTAAGLGGVLLTISLFFLPNTNPQQAVAHVETPLLNLSGPGTTDTAFRLLPNQPTPDTNYLPPFPNLTDTTTTPNPTPSTGTLGSPYLEGMWNRLVMPFGWDDRRLATTVSLPEPMQVAQQWAQTLADGWVRAIPRLTSQPLSPTFAPYREMQGLREWGPVTPAVAVSDSVARNAEPLVTSRPQAIVEKRVPSTTLPRQPLRYQVLVTNPSDHPLEEVTVFEALDVNRVTATEPPALIEPNGLLWRLGGLAAGETRQLVIEYWMEGLTGVEPVTEVELAASLGTKTLVEGNTGTPFFEPEPQPAPVVTPPVREVITPPFPGTNELPPFPTELEAPQVPVNPAPMITPFRAVDAEPSIGPLLRLTATAPEDVLVGDEAVTWYEVENIGDAPAEDLQLTVTLPSGLLHHDGTHEVVHRIVSLPAGEKRRAQLITRVEQPGLFSLSGQLVAGDLWDETRVEFVAAAPDVADPPASESALEDPEMQVNDLRPLGRLTTDHALALD
jgi:hypothetical protein